jgi:hypothetical protein
MPIEVSPAPKKPEREPEVIRPVQIPELKKETVTTPISHIGLRSELKK